MRDFGYPGAQGGKSLALRQLPVCRFQLLRALAKKLMTTPSPIKTARGINATARSGYKDQAGGIRKYCTVTAETIVAAIPGPRPKNQALKRTGISKSKKGNGFKLAVISWPTVSRIISNAATVRTA